MAKHAHTTGASTREAFLDGGTPRRVLLPSVGWARRPALPTTGTTSPRRPLAADLLALEGEQGAITSDILRARLENLAQQVIDMLDALDAQYADLEPDHDGEAEPDEASAQPATLAPLHRSTLRRGLRGSARA